MFKDFIALAGAKNQLAELKLITSLYDVSGHKSFVPVTDGMEFVTNSNIRIDLK